ncbi:hydroxymethylpyrimidine/phosphomethylpyrimidine kinase [Desulfohalotomaculum tongense]|uniref:bifunctional hydroxymethylpyrimidine kinase/phosphomethylpyrimidine kinase n=1 Tax=Desulforadius tongensis TaxID=1216062 RepID=UPI00195A1357|nr:bifunctional hydroxymethylpyrimidine kinase/phosphomethylpyrimidine kinase [Desulforadius tongensis]MBM7855440.1 hydroxymethylpyrimidine/phosphomethylpyrimidine kinase [Desulforadius tongensis]
MKAALTIAGSDSGGGAGIQADLKTFAAHGVYGTSIITAVTAQNTTGVQGVAEIEPSFVALQMKSVLEDIKIDAIKIGMLSSTEIIKSVARVLKEYPHIPVVLDPVMVAKSGDHLLQPSARQALIDFLFPLAKVITPNLHEAGVIANFTVKSMDDMKKAAQVIKSMGASNILVKGGHLPGDAVDLLYDGKKFSSFTARRLSNKNTHGTGCTYSSAIAANLAKGLDLENAVAEAKKYITGAIENAFPVGRGVGPTNHFFKIYR